MAYSPPYNRDDPAHHTARDQRENKSVRKNHRPRTQRGQDPVLHLIEKVRRVHQRQREPRHRVLGEQLIDVAPHQIRTPQAARLHRESFRLQPLLQQGNLRGPPGAVHASITIKLPVIFAWVESTSGSQKNIARWRLRLRQQPSPGAEERRRRFHWCCPLVEFDPSEITGSLIVIEGMDGSGRSTQITLLQEWLESEGFAVQTSGLRRSNLVGRDIDELLAKNAVTRLTLALMYATDFFDQVEHRILPALRSGRWFLRTDLFSR